MPDFLPARFDGGRRLPGWLLCLLLAAPWAARAQGTAAVSGQVTSTAGLAVEFATVTLHRAKDSTVVKTEFSDVQGTYRLEAAAGGRYLVSAAQAGFGRYWSAAFELPTAGATLPVIRLTASKTVALQEVTVPGRKPLFEHLADRTVVNVADSPLSAGATALDVLNRSPGVGTNSSGFTLRGRSGVLVVLDGKRVPLTGDELASYLRALPAGQLQSIELITNPTAQYDAQGSAGVIDIHLKKDQRLGTNGSANASYGRGQYGKFTAGLTLNHRRKNVNFFGSYVYADRRDFARQDFSRQYVSTSALPAATSTIEGLRLLNVYSHSAKLGTDVTVSKRTVLGVSLNGLLNQTTSNNESQTSFFKPEGVAEYRYASTAAQDISRPSGSTNLNLRHTFADSATAATLTADADYAHYRTARELVLTTNYQYPVKPSSVLTGDQANNLIISAVKADFSSPLPRRARFEGGLKATRITSDNHVAFYNNGAYNPLISSTFSYYENVQAAYVNLRGTAAKCELQAGLRAEQTTIRTASSGEGLREREYLQFFPSASVQRTFNARHVLGASVGRRLDRPSYAQLNPLRTYFDAVSYRSGNPDLVAQTSYNFSLTHTYRQKFSTALGYSQTTQPIVLVVQPSPDGGRLVVNREVNLTTLDYYSLTLTAPLEPTKWWTLYANGVFYYSRFRGALAGTALDRQQPTCQLTASNTFALSHGWSAELNGTFESGEIWGFERTRPRGQVLAGFQKNFWEKRGTFRFNVSDLFYTAVVRPTATYDNFTESFVLRQDTRVATAAFTYRFGNIKVAAARKHAVGAEDELRRSAGQ